MSAPVWFARAAALLAAISLLSSCGFKGPLALADPAAPVDKSIATSKVPDAESAAPPASQDPERVIDDGDAEDETP